MDGSCAWPCEAHLEKFAKVPQFIKFIKFSGMRTTLTGASYVATHTLVIFNETLQIHVHANCVWN